NSNGKKTKQGNHQEIVDISPCTEPQFHVPNAHRIPPRPPKASNLGFETIVNEKLKSSPKVNTARVLRAREKNQDGGSPSPLIQSISLPVFWLWKMIMLLLHGFKAPFYAEISPMTTVGGVRTIVDEKPKSKRGGSRKKST
ncbi:unnamed protein product, partial [Sphenostylis stenocarpa]